jgi:diguanylate cyclase (GGDEF)-like protein/PAS domain S-box-containing protein
MKTNDAVIKNYDTYSAKFQKLQEIDFKLEQNYFKIFKYLHYDEINTLKNEFETTLSSLKQSSIKEEFGNSIYLKLLKIEKDYTKKSSLLETFKMYNAKVINSGHYLYDLHKIIDKTYIENQELNRLISSLFFRVSQVLVDLPYDKEGMRKDIEHLKAYEKENKLFKQLSSHLNIFLDAVGNTKRVREENKQLILLDDIVDIQNNLDDYYKHNRSINKKITLIFFFFAYGILFILMFNYRRVLKSTRELLAFRSAIQNSDNIVMITDANRKIEYVNESFEKSTGYTQEEVLGKNPNLLQSGKHEKAFYEDLNNTLKQGEKWQGELVNSRKDGTTFYEKASIVPILIENQIVQYIAIKLDITEYIEHQKYLKQSATIYETIGEGIMLIDKERKIQSINPAFREMFSYSEAMLVGEELMANHRVKEEAYLYQEMWDSLIINDHWSRKIDHQTANGDYLSVWFTISVVKDEEEQVQNYVAIYTNLTQINQMEEKVNYMAYHDALTGLHNRAYFEQYMTHRLNVKSNMKKAILFIDLDRFKVINDTLGHHIGDEMLIELSKRLQKVASSTDTVARIGGDEFVMILDNIEKKDEVIMIAEAILSTVREPIHIDDYYLNTTVSIGIALYPEDGENKNEIVKNADAAMYHAKENGKDNFQFYTKQLSLDVQNRLMLEQELLHALDKNELILHFQPQYYLHNRKISGAEALLRWQNEKLGWVSPVDFIEVAEETGLIVDIGYFVFEEACRTFMQWKKEGLAVGTISINMSSIQFREEDLVEKLKAIMNKIGILASEIEIEITESFIMEYSNSNMHTLEQLRKIGCEISIDDFGTGYSSLSYMKTLSLDTIKIDRSFVMELPENLHDVEVTKAIIALSKSLGYQVIAEGIENAEQEAFLNKNHCDIGQGYYFAKPMSHQDFIQFAKKNQSKS